MYEMMLKWEWKWVDDGSHELPSLRMLEKGWIEEASWFWESSRCFRVFYYRISCPGITRQAIVVVQYGE